MTDVAHRAPEVERRGTGVLVVRIQRSVTAAAARIRTFVKMILLLKSWVYGSDTVSECGFHLNWIASFSRNSIEMVGRRMGSRTVCISYGLAT